MKRIFIGILLSISLNNINAQSFAWAKKGGLWAYDYGYGIATDGSGNVYVAGKYEQNANFSGTVLPCQGNHDIFVAKYNPLGGLIWIRTAGGPAGDYAHTISCDGNYVYIAGEIEGSNSLIKFQGSAITLKCKGNNDIFMAKYTLTGNLVWAKRAGSSSDDKALGISYDNSGNVYICGYFTNTVTFGSTTLTGFGDNDIFVAKYDPNGNCIWAKKAGGGGKDEAKSIRIDATGNIYICGKYKYSANFSGQILSNPDSKSNAFIAKYSSNGTLLWARQAGKSWNDVAWSLTLDNSGKIFVTGEFSSSIKFGTLPTLYTSGNADVFVVCYNANGDALWAKKAGGGMNDRGRGIGTDGNNIFITGQFGKNSTFGSIAKSAVDNSDIFISGLSNSGTFLWVSSVGGPADADETLGFESGNAVCAQPSGNVYATGSMLNGGIFGSTSLPAFSRTDVFVTKIFAPAQQKDADSTDAGLCRDTICLDMGLKTFTDEKHVSERAFNIFPNPGTGLFTLEMNFQYEDLFEITIFNSFGQEIDKKMLSAPSKTTIDLSEREKGIYFVDIILRTERKILKVILE